MPRAGDRRAMPSRSRRLPAMARPAAEASAAPDPHSGIRFAHPAARRSPPCRRPRPYVRRRTRRADRATAPHAAPELPARRAHCRASTDIRPWAAAARTPAPVAEIRDGMPGPRGMRRDRARQTAHKLPHAPRTCVQSPHLPHQYAGPRIAAVPARPVLSAQPPSFARCCCRVIRQTRRTAAA